MTTPQSVGTSNLSAAAAASLPVQGGVHGILPGAPGAAVETDRLNDQNLHRVPDHIETPIYNRAHLKTGIVALGGTSRLIGGLGFAVIDDFLNANAADPDKQIWGVAAVGFHRQGPIDALNRQNGLFTKVGLGPGPHGEATVTPRVIGCVKEALHAGHQGARVIELIAARDTKIITLSILAKNYFAGKTGGIDTTKCDDLRDDVRNPGNSPKTALGLLVAGLYRRMITGHEGVAIVPFDNLPPPSGKFTKDVILSFAEAAQGFYGPELVGWIARNVYCPNTMVDLICPEETPQLVSQVQLLTGLVDRRPLITEWDGARHFVIEISGPEGQRFAGANPFQAEGVTFTPSDGQRYGLVKEAKVNADHVWLTLMGEYRLYDPTVDEVARCEDLVLNRAEFLESELVPSIRRHAPSGMDLDGYCAIVDKRFLNPMGDRISRISKDCHGRLRRLTAIIHRLVDDHSPESVDPIVIDETCNALACWVITRTTGLAAGGRPINVTESAATVHEIEEAKVSSRFSDVLAAHGYIRAVQGAFCEMCNRGVFGETAKLEIFVPQMLVAIHRMGLLLNQVH